MEPFLHSHSMVSRDADNITFIVTCHWSALGYQDPIISTPSSCAVRMPELVFQSGGGGGKGGRDGG
jgi:hypothetical protein